MMESLVAPLSLHVSVKGGAVLHAAREAFKSITDDFVDAGGLVDGVWHCIHQRH